MDEVYLTVDEMADQMKTCTATVYHLARAGKLPGVKVGRLWRFTRQGYGAMDFEQYEEGNRDFVYSQSQLRRRKKTVTVHHFRESDTLSRLV